MDLFDYAERYPRAPGAKGTDTSREAARKMGIRCCQLQQDVLVALREAGPFGLTAHEVAAKLGKDKMAISPRISELRALGKIVQTEERRKNASGMSAAVWRINR